MTDKSNWHVKGGFPTANHLVDDLQTLFFVFSIIVISYSRMKILSQKDIYIIDNLE